MATKREVTILIKAVDRASRTLRSISNTSTDSLKNVANQAQAAATALAGMGAAVGVSLGLAVKTTADFEQSLANTQSVIGATTDELMLLTDAAREMGKVSVFSASQAADAMFFLASAGLNTEKVIESLGGTMALAAATNSDLAFTTETVVANLAAFGLQAKESDRIANVFAATISGSQATMERLSTAMSFVAPVARAVNLSIEETSAILGRLFTSGIAASTAGTALRQSIAQLLKPTDDAKEIMERLGITALDSGGNLRNLIDIIRNLETSGLTAADAMTLFGVRAGPAMLALVNQGANAIDALTNKITGTNKAAEMAALQIDTFKGQMRLLKSAAQELAIVVGTELIPTLKEYLSTLTDVVNRTATWAKEHRTFTKTVAISGAVFVATAATLGTFLISIAAIGKISAGAIAGIQGLQKALFFLGNTTVLLRLRLLLLAKPLIATLGVSVLGGITGGILLMAGALGLFKKQVDDTRRELNFLTDAEERRRGNMAGQQAAIDQLTRVLEVLREEQRKGTLAVSLLGTELKQADGKVKGFSREVAPIASQIARIEQKLEELRTQLRTSGLDIFQTTKRVKEMGLAINLLFQPFRTIGEALTALQTKLKITKEELIALRGEMKFLQEPSFGVKQFEAMSAAVDQFGEDIGNVKRAVNEFIEVLPKGFQFRLLDPDDLKRQREEAERLAEFLERISSDEIPIFGNLEPQLEGLRAIREGTMEAVQAALDFSEQLGLDVDARALQRTQAEAEVAAKIADLNQQRLEAEADLAQRINSIRESSFMMEQRRIRDLGRGYANFISNAISIGRRFFSEQEAGWIRALAALVRFATRTIAAFLRERSLEKLKQADQAKTTSQFFIQHGAKMLALAAEFALVGDIGRSIAAGVEAVKAGAQAGFFAGQAAVLQTEAAGLAVAATAVEVSGAVLADGIDAAADAAQRAARERERQARDQERRLDTEIRLKQEILELEGRTAEARQLAIQQEIDQLRGQGIDEGLISRFEQLQLAQAGVNTGIAVQPLPQEPATIGGITPIANQPSVMFTQTNTFVGIIDVNNQEQLAELARQLKPFTDELVDLETDA